MYCCRILAEPPRKRPTDLAEIRNPNDFNKVLGDPRKGEVFRRAVQSHGGEKTLKESVLKLSQSLEGFFHLRQNFVSSHALVSIVSWLMTIGDR